MPNQTEPTVNAALGKLLQAMMQTCLVRSEHTGLIPDNPALQIDNLITAPGRSPVALEAEFMPASNAESEAASRLAKNIVGQPRPVEAAIALRYPAELKSAADLETALRETRLSWCVRYDEGDLPPSRFPQSGWLEGGLEDLADLIRLVSVPQKEVDEAADTLQSGIQRAAVVLDAISETQMHIVRAVSDLLGMRNVPQTRRMACAIIANALVFHERIAGMHAGVKPLNLVCGPGSANPQKDTLATWDQILDINYFPIFAIARDILQQLPSGAAKQLLDELRDTAQEVDAAGIDNAHNLTGRIFQRLISDRKYLATFYTRPASAALLARLAVAKLQDIDWSDAERIAKLRVGDFACGTGALLSAAYEQIAAKHERAGGDPAKLHTAMMEEVLYGCDVMPSAVHITGATLAGAQPNLGYQQSRLYTMPYGRQDDGSVQIGSLELLQASNLLTLFNTSDPALQTGSAGEQTAAQVTVDIPDGGFDLVIMNPPFTSNTKHFDAEDGVLNAAFAAFNAKEDDQADMAALLAKLAKGSTYHGHAGLGSAFITIAHRKLKTGGVMAFVLLASMVNASSWQKVRKLLATEYEDIEVLTIAESGDQALSFSNDTGMAECLVIARKRVKKGTSGGADSRGKFTSVLDRPRNLADAAGMSGNLASHLSIRKIEDGPYGGTALSVGSELRGETLEAPAPVSDTGWGAARLSDATVGQVAASLSDGKLWLPTNPQPANLPIKPLGHVGHRGIDSQLFISPAHKGPFAKGPASPTATYPVLWKHDAKHETKMVCQPDSQFVVRKGMELKAADLWKSASRAHLSRGFRFTSQPLAVAMTEVKTAGGRAWPNVTFDTDSYDYAFAVWGNSTLGLLLYWWHSNRSQSGRGDMTVKTMHNLPVLDLNSLSDDQLQTAEDIFDDFRNRDLKPAYLADADPNRARLDRRLICDLLNFDHSTYQAVRQLAAKWCAEPSVHGGKARPPGSELVV